MRNMVNLIGYCEQLRLKREASQAQRAALPKPPTLNERISAWSDALPSEDKTRPWHMSEFRSLFGESPQKLAEALWGLGWTRKRMWRDDRPTARYWFRPTD